LSHSQIPKLLTTRNPYFSTSNIHFLTFHNQTMLSLVLHAMAALSLGSSTLAAVTQLPYAVGDADVLSYLDSIGHVVEWNHIDNETRLATFANADWETWKNEVHLAGGSTPLTASSDVSVLDRDLFARDPVACYGSGSWAYSSVIVGVIAPVCSGFSYGVVAG
jgi:hypothetical protein